MFRHHLLIALRSFNKDRSSFSINIIGLSTGLACAIFVFLWVSDELGFDKFHEKEGQLYQVITNLEMDGQIFTLEDSPFLLPKAITQEFPEVEEAAAISSEFSSPEGILSYGETKHTARGLFATPNFFEVLSFTLSVGDIGQVLHDKKSIVISTDLAKTLFGSEEEALGKALDWNYQWEDGGGELTLQVSGIFEAPPKNSTLQFDYLVHFDVLIDDDKVAGNWTGHYAKTFLVLKEGTRIADFNKKISGYLASKRAQETPFTLVSFVQKFSERYLKNPYENGVQVGGRIVYIRLFILIGLFILVIACINFMNLATAQASRRIKEVGVKKTIGADRPHLIAQYLGESVLLSFFALGVALVLVWLFLPQFNVLTGKSVVLGLKWKEVLSLVAITLFTGLFAGSYPAFRLSAFKPIEVLSGKLSTSFGEFWIRKGLVIFQFTLSVIFIVGVLVINKQMEFALTKNLGYARDNIVRFELGSNNESPETFLSELGSIADVKQVSFMNGDFLDGSDNNSGWSWPGNASSGNIVFQSPRMGYGALETLGIQLTEGRTFSREHNDATGKIIINESAQKLMGLENPVGKILHQGERTQEIIGVVKDFQYGSIHKKIEPLIIRFRNFGHTIMVQITGSSEEETLAQMERLYTKHNPGHIFDYSFLDNDYQTLYSSEEKLAKLSQYFAFLAILISCLGLIGLTKFTTQKRAKEISIRKVLGASVPNLVAMLSGEFVKMVLIAVLIALPIGYWASMRWLENFGYAIELKWWFFALAGSLGVFISVLTISWRCFKSAMVNPATKLRTE
ncbi:MAG: ABC transporter permease [Bacteroidota bacterium]